MTQTRRGILLVLGLWAFAVPSPRPAAACAPVGRRGNPVRIDVVQESAIIVWDAAHKTQHFIRRAAFNTQAKDFGFLVPTPTRPELAEASDLAFSQLQQLTAPPVHTVYRTVERTPSRRGARATFGGVAAARMARPAVEVLETARVAGFDAAVLKASDPRALNEWLKKHDYASGPDLVAWLAPYVKQEWTITAFKIAKDRPNTGSVATSAVRMSFQTQRPFFPYREPAYQREVAQEYTVKRGRFVRGTARLLQVFFIGDARVQGTLGKGGEWRGRVVWSNPMAEPDRKRLLDLLHLEKLELPTPYRLTELEDRSSPRPGTDDVFFSPSADQSEVTKPPIARVVYRYVSPSLGRPSRTPMASNLAKELSDPAFNRYVDLDLLGMAWRELDSVSMTDVALQLAQGEQVLRRSHKAVSADKLIELAIKVAAGNRDSESLMRLARVADRTGNKELAARAAAAEKLARAPRAAGSEPTISPADQDPDILADVHMYLHTARQAQLAGRKDLLEGLSQSADGLPSLTEELRTYVKDRFEEMAGASDQPDPVAQLLDRLFEDVPTFLERSAADVDPGRQSGWTRKRPRARRPGAFLHGTG